MTPEQLDAIQARHRVAESLKVKPNGDSHTREYVRGLEAVATDVPALLAYARDLEERNQRVRELHVPEPCDPGCCDGDLCSECLSDYPCPTIAALTATEGQA